MDNYDIIIKPLITEKSTKLMDTENKYVFKVNKHANKIQIKNAVESIFKVHVTKVTTMIMHGKKRRVRYQQGRKPDWKKAIVTLKQGDRIEILEG
jgi:large subunit ribosomal protein L23